MLVVARAEHLEGSVEINGTLGWFKRVPPMKSLLAGLSLGILLAAMAALVLWALFHFAVLIAPFIRVFST